MSNLKGNPHLGSREVVPGGAIDIGYGYFFYPDRAKSVAPVNFDEGYTR
jgi:hypothetical protein